jgi:hypothetical protein
MLDAQAAVIAAQRPAVLAQVTGTPGAGRTLTLDGSQSAASIGRSIASYAWTVESLAGGATTPVLASANTAMASLVTPGQGTVVLRLTVTDNLGSSDFATVSITGTGGVSSAPPPAPAPTSGGGGDVSIFALLFAALWVVQRQLARRAILRT